MRAEQRPASPCTGVCRLDQDGALCIGCHRTPVEIGAWPRAGDDERRRILERVAIRRAALHAGSESSVDGA